MFTKGAFTAALWQQQLNLWFITTLPQAQPEAANDSTTTKVKNKKSLQKAAGCWETLASLCTWQTYKSNNGQVTGKQSFYKNTSRHPPTPCKIPLLHISSIHNPHTIHRSTVAKQVCAASDSSSSLAMAPVPSVMRGSEISKAEAGTLFHGTYIDMMSLQTVHVIEVPESSRGKPQAKHGFFMDLTKLSVRHATQL